MDILNDYKFCATPPTTSATLPTPAQTPQTKGFPTPIADSYGDIFNLEALAPPGGAPAYTDAELESVLTPPPQEVTIWYGTHVLHGMFYYLPSLSFQLHGRFMDISPFELPRLSDGNSKPWVVFSEAQDKSWVDESFLRCFNVDTAQQPNNEPRFVAITDRLDVMHSALEQKISALGTISLHGALECNSAINASNNLMVALPCNKPLYGTRRALNDGSSQSMIRTTAPPKKEDAAILIKDYPPAPVSSAVLDAVETMLSAKGTDLTLYDPAPKRAWITDNLHEHLKMIHVPSISTNSTFSSSSPAPPSSPSAPPQRRSTRAGPYVLCEWSPLWSHRGNEALFKRNVWMQLCYASSQTDANVESKGGVKIPPAYWQVLFEDLQARERVSGGDQLSEVDAKWYAAGMSKSVNGDGGGVDALRKTGADGSLEEAIGGGLGAGVWGRIKGS